MNTHHATISVSPALGKQIQMLARHEDKTVNELLRAALRTYRKANEEPTPALLRALKQSEKDVKTGRVSPSFTTAKDAIAWLDDSSAIYANGDKVHK